MDIKTLCKIVFILAFIICVVIYSENISKVKTVENMVNYNTDSSEKIINSENPKLTKVITITQTPLETPTETPIDNIAINSLTGLEIDKSIEYMRPVAVVINNLKKALPQSGISQADIYYEVLAEGDITRIVAIFKDFSSKKIGPIRSTRDYFIDFALDNDAILVHHGGSPGGYSAIKTLGVFNLDGMVLEGSAFWRDKSRISKSGMYEHSSYSNAENILKQIDKSGIRKDVFEDEEKLFSFNMEKDTKPSEDLAKKITVPFSSTYKAIFSYNEEDKMYYKSNDFGEQIDEENGKQIYVKNVIVQNVNSYIISGDEAGRRKVEIIGNGDGYYISEGAYKKIKWEKIDHKIPTKWYDEEGNNLKLNKGKTYICVQNGETMIE